MENEVMPLYRQFRNYLRKHKLNESLQAIHGHSQFQQFGQPLPRYITGTPLGYRNSRDRDIILDFHVAPWELALLCKEIVINSQEYGAKHSILEWYFFSNSINRLKEFENKLTSLYSTKDNVLLELFRLSHRQFKWQRKAKMDAPARYWKLFGNKSLHNIIEQKIGLSLEDIIKIGLSLLGLYQDKIALNYPPHILVQGITQNKFDIFLAHFCTSYVDLKSKLIAEQEYNEKFVYSYSSLTAYPLIRKEWFGRESILCPIPRYLYERITDGLYYEICHDKNFEHPFGEAFQEYIGEVIKASYIRGKIYPELDYGKGKKTVDWIIEDNTSALFIECKTKRLRTSAKASLFDLTELESELGKIADAVVQVYKTMMDFKNGLYQNIKHDPNKSIYPIVVTLENWFIFGDVIVSKLDELILQRLKYTELNPSIIISNPYYVISTESFEKLMNILNHHDIEEVLGVKARDDDKRLWEMDSYLIDKYSDEFTNAACPFVSDLERKIDLMLTEQQT